MKIRNFLSIEGDVGVESARVDGRHGSASVVGLFAGCGGFDIGYKDELCFEDLEEVVENRNQHQKHQFYGANGENSRAETRQAENHAGGRGGDHRAHYRVRWSGGGTEGIRAHVCLVCHIPWLARDGSGDSPVDSREAKTPARRAAPAGHRAGEHAICLYLEQQRGGKSRSDGEYSARGSAEWFRREGCQCFTH